MRAPVGPRAPSPRAPFLVLGFGPFRDVHDNPSRRLALALDGSRVGGRRVIGREMPVRYGVSVDLTEALVATHQPVAVLGVGVAVSRTRPELERFGRRQAELGQADVSGLERPPSGAGPALRPARGALEPFAAGLGAALSDDAGQYVCNAWLHDCLGRLDPEQRVLFLHLPPQGVPPERVLSALPALLGGAPARVG